MKPCVRWSFLLDDEIWSIYCQSMLFCFRKGLRKMKLHVDLKERGYDIVMERGVLKRLAQMIDVERKVLLVSDSKVPAQWVDLVKSQCPHCYVKIVPAGEASKSFAVWEELLSYMLENRFLRSDLVIALGGGVVGDLAGFAAACYMRGIDFVNIPTTTLAQIDSSIGGKTAINAGGVKNNIGAFYQPRKVLIDFDTLSTLPRRHYLNGLVEALKAGLIYDPALFSLFENGDIDEHLEEIIYRSLCMKKDVVEQDERESGLRKILNFGHTIGHAIEGYYHMEEYLHGECVAMGMLYFIEDDELRERTAAILRRMGVPSDAPYEKEDVYRRLSADKKALHEGISVVTVKTLGKAEIKTLSYDEIKAKLKG